jgi:hypothetical protein
MRNEGKKEEIRTEGKKERRTEEEYEGGEGK